MLMFDFTIHTVGLQTALMLGNWATASVSTTSGTQTAPMLEDVASASVHPISWFTDGAHVGGCGVRFGDSNQTGKMKSCDAYLSQLGSVCIVK